MGVHCDPTDHTPLSHKTVVIRDRAYRLSLQQGRGPVLKGIICSICLAETERLNQFSGCTFSSCFSSWTGFDSVPALRQPLPSAFPLLGTIQFRSRFTIARPQLDLIELCHHPLHRVLFTFNPRLPCHGKIAPSTRTHFFLESEDRSQCESV